MSSRSSLHGTTGRLLIDNQAETDKKACSYGSVLATGALSNLTTCVLYFRSNVKADVSGENCAVVTLSHVHKIVQSCSRTVAFHAESIAERKQGESCEHREATIGT